MRYGSPNSLTYLPSGGKRGWGGWAEGNRRRDGRTGGGAQLGCTLASEGAGGDGSGGRSARAQATRGAAAARGDSGAVERSGGGKAITACRSAATTGVLSHAEWEHGGRTEMAREAERARAAS